MLRCFAVKREDKSAIPCVGVGWLTGEWAVRFAGITDPPKTLTLRPHGDKTAPRDSFTLGMSRALILRGLRTSPGFPGRLNWLICASKLRD